MIKNNNDAIDRKFANFFRSLEQFIGTVKVHNNECNKILFYLGTGGFYNSIGTIQTPIGTNNLDVETYKKKLENICTYLCIPFEVKKCKSWYVVWCSLMYTFLGLGGYSRFLSIQHDFWHQKYAFNFSFYFEVWQFKSSLGRI